ncbi:MAG: putative heptosyltransferase family protein, partial [Leptospirillum sp. Group IV 'UBA BS']
DAFLAYAHFPMRDRHARQESTLEATAETIGLPLGKDVRPYLPLLPSDIQWASNFLSENNLKKDGYAVIAPLSWPNKMWGKSNFESLIDHLYQNFGLRTVVASYPAIGLFTNSGAVCAYDLSLGQLAGLLSLAGLYIGLDSGPSHMCAFFDVPMLVLYIEKKVIPFEVRTLSPHSLLVVESFFSSAPLPSIETVFDSVRFLLEMKSNKDEETPECLACGRRVDHVVATDGVNIRLMCSCGLVCDEIIHKTESGKFPQIRNQGKENSTTQKPLNLQDPLQIEDILENEEALKQKNSVAISLTLSPIDSKSSELTPGNFIWGFDSLIYWMGKRSYLPFEFSWDHDKLLIKFSKSSYPERDRLIFPWGKKKFVTSMSRYLCWYTFSRWSDPKILVGIVKSMTELNLSKKERFACSIDAFRAEPSLRSLRWIIKSLLRLH